MSAPGQNDIARRYATALFELAKDAGQVDQIEADLRQIQAVAADRTVFERFAQNPTLRRADQVKAVSAIADELKLSALSKKFIGAIAENRRLSALGAVAAAALALIAEHKGEVFASVTSAVALDAEQTQQLTAHLQKVTGKKIRLDLHVDAALIGGLVVRVGSKLMDSSIRTKLDRLSRSLTSSTTTADSKKMKEVA